MDNKRIKTIAHLADLHIRKLHRHNEYRAVFRRLYKQLRSLKPDLIVICGDIVHTKLDTSPEEIRLIANLFLNLAKIASTVVIPGNHDANLNNKSREDALSPITDLIKKINPNLHYWKKSGKYTLNNVDFGVLSVFDIDKNGNQTIDNLPNSKDMNSEYKVALYHGQVGTFLMDNNFKVTSDRVTMKDFNGYDLILLGDIHRRQFLNQKKNCAYPGSLLQQGFAEESSHGFLFWDLENKKADYYVVENDYGFKIIDVIKGEIQNKMDFVPLKGTIKIRYWNTELNRIRDIKIDLWKKYPKLKTIKAEKQDILSLDKNNKIDKAYIGDIQNIDYQNKLIAEYLESKIENIDKETISRVCKINRMINNTPEINEAHITRNVNWKIKTLEFDNMFSYKEGNKIDFSKMNGICGLIGRNRLGKSSIPDSIAYTIFDTCSRTYKAIEVLNKKKKKFSTKVNLEIDDVDYWIERIGKLKVSKSRKTGEISRACPVKVKFYMKDDDNNRIDLTGASRRTTQYGKGTNNEIRRILGKFDDFILTSLSLQNNGIDFIDKRQTDRKLILSQFLNIDIFDKLYDIAKGDSNEERTLLKTFRKKESYSYLTRTETLIKNSKNQKEVLLKEIDEIDREITDIENTKLELIRKRWNIDIKDFDIDKTLDLIKDKKQKKKDLEKTLKDDVEYREILRPQYLEYHKKIEIMDEDKINKDFEIFQTIQKEMDKCEMILKSIDSSILSNKTLYKKFDEYEYDNDCYYCAKNAQEYVKNKNEIKNDINSLNVERNILLNKIDTIKLQLEELRNAEISKKDYDSCIEELNQIAHGAIKVNGRITTLKEKIKLLERDVFESLQNIEKYNKNKQKINENKEIDKQIDGVLKTIDKLFFDKKNKDKEYQKIISSLAVLENEESSTKKDINNLIKCEQKIHDYDYYLMAVNRDGIPYELVSRTIPIIEAEVNEVLSNMLVNFTIKIEMSGKNIDIYIHDGKDYWNLELASGMEKFVSNLAMRIGLINVSTLPRPNFLCIDEGFGSLDSESLNSIESVFSYLKLQFDFVLIITHLDVIKDYMDKLITIKKTKSGFSQIEFV